MNLLTRIREEIAAALAAERLEMVVSATDIGTVTGTPDGWSTPVTAVPVYGLTASVGHRVLLRRSGRGYIAIARMPSSGGGGPS